MKLENRTLALQNSYNEYCIVVASKWITIKGRDAAQRQLSGTRQSGQDHCTAGCPDGQNNNGPASRHLRHKSSLQWCFQCHFWQFNRFRAKVYRWSRRPPSDAKSWYYVPIFCSKSYRTCSHKTLSPSVQSTSKVWSHFITRFWWR